MCPPQDCLTDPLASDSLFLTLEKERRERAGSIIPGESLLQDNNEAGVSPKNRVMANVRCVLTGLPPGLRAFPAWLSEALHVGQEWQG